MNGWLPTQPGGDGDPDFREGQFFGIDRSVPPVRFFSEPSPRGLFQKLRDAWLGMLNGFQYGPGDD